MNLSKNYTSLNKTGGKREKISHTLVYIGKQAFGIAENLKAAGGN